jgi:ribonuclease E
MRDEHRPHDAFSWVRPWVPYGDDPFVWYDPAEDLKVTAPGADHAPPAQAAAPAPRAEAVATPRPAVRDSGDDNWVELPATDEKPKRARRGRGRGRGRADGPSEGATEAMTEAAADAPTPNVVETVAAPEPEFLAAEPEVAEAPAKPARARRSRKAAPEVVDEVVAEAPTAPEPEPEILAQAEPAPPSEPAAPDPAEISGPASTPRRGWWRRG